MYIVIRTNCIMDDNRRCVKYVTAQGTLSPRRSFAQTMTYHDARALIAGCSSLWIILPA